MMSKVKIEIEANGPKGYRIALFFTDDKGHNFVSSHFVYCDTFTIENLEMKKVLLNQGGSE